MPSLWLPQGPAEAIMAEKAGFDEARRVQHVLEGLRGIDPRLGMFLCDREDPENDLRMGFWYVYRRNPDSTVAMWEISNPDDSYREPAWDIVEAFQKMDRESLQDFRDDRDRKLRAKKREAERKQEEASWNFKDQCDFAFRTQIPVTADWKK